MNAARLNEIEFCVVGSVMLAGKASKAAAIIRELTPDMFLNPHCGEAWHALTRLVQESAPLDAVTIKNACRVPEDVLIAFMEAVPSASSGQYYAGLVREAWGRRTIIARAAELTRNAQSDEVPMADVLAEAAAISTGAMIPGQVATDIADIPLRDSPRGLPTGFSEIDSRLITRGLPRGQFTAIGADSGVGKSAIGQQLAAMWAEDFHVVYATFSDLNEELLKWRWMKQGTGYMSWENRTLEQQESMRSYQECTLDMLSLKVYDGTKKGGEVEAFLAWLEGLHANWRVDAWVVDYVQMMHSKTMRSGEVQQQIMKVSNLLATAASRIGAVGVVLSQVDAERGEFRYSRQIKMDAGFGFIIDRDPDGVMAKCKVVKNRFGMYGDFSLKWDPNYTRFMEW